MMSKQANIVFFSVIGLILFSVAISIGVTLFSAWGGIVYGVIIIILSIIIFQMGKTNPFLYRVSYCLNYIATGLSVSAFYNHIATEPSLDIYFVCSFVVFVCILMFYLLSRINIMKDAMPFIITFFIIASLATIVVLATEDTGILYSSLFFFIQVCYFHIIAFYIENAHTIHHNIALFSFGLYAIVTYIVVLILSEGEALDLLAHGGWAGGDKKSQSK